MKYTFLFALFLLACGSDNVTPPDQACFSKNCYDKVADPRVRDGGPVVFLFDCGDVMETCQTTQVAEKTVVKTSKCDSGYAKAWSCDSGMQLHCYCP